VTGVGPGSHRPADGGGDLGHPAAYGELSIHQLERILAGIRAI
jgi:hypothetical protein